MTNILVIDLETTVRRIEGRIDNSPKNPENKLISAHYGWLGSETVDVVHTDVFYHNECFEPDGTSRLVDHLNKADIAVLHNAKFDVEWLQEIGLPIPPKVICTMIIEYCLLKGRFFEFDVEGNANRTKISLKDTAERRNTKSYKKSELIDEKFNSGMDFSEIPLTDVVEYAEADVRVCGEIYLSQLKDLAKEENQSLNSVIDFMSDMLMFLCEIEMNGVKIDMEALKQVEEEFLAEKNELTERLQEIVSQVIGDKPINLNSGADMTKVVYSREVTDRDLHKTTFNIGTNKKGKPNRPPYMSAKQFAIAVRSTTKIIMKTQAVTCPDCSGKGDFQQFKSKTRTKHGKKYKVKGDPYKNRTKCKPCDGKGALYASTGEEGGLGLNPLDPYYASINGFKTDKETIQLLINQAKGKKKDLAVEFLTKISRLNAISTYLDSFVKGIIRGTRSSGLLHANFNQTIAATGRLSSGGGISLNLQNMPKRGFPVRKCMISRFGDRGILCESDYSSLEFRVCVELSRDEQGMADILEGKDIHRQTASICLKKDASEVTKDERNSHKWASFQPLFGGTGNGQPDHIKSYFDRFYEIYEGIYEWHQSLMTGTLKNGLVQTPSGRQYFWPDVSRTRGNRVTNATQILNYPVQGFSADLVQLACIRTFKMFKEQKLQSKLILTVHDSIVVDCLKDELEAVKAILTEAMTQVGEETKLRFGYQTIVPLDIEISSGKNWLDQVEMA